MKSVERGLVSVQLREPLPQDRKDGGRKKLRSSQPTGASCERGGGKQPQRSGKVSSCCERPDEKRSGKLIISKEDLEQHIKGQYVDVARDTLPDSPGYVPRPDVPKTPFDTSPPRLCEIREALQNARAGSTPGPNVLPYKLYKNCRQVTKIVWNLIRVVWKKKSIPVECQEAVGIFIPKEQNSTAISQFRSIALLNMEGKVFFTVLAKWIARFLNDNSYIDTNCQKAGLPGFPGCIEHASMIWEQIQCAKREKSDLHVVWLDMANAYGSVTHKLVEFVLEFFHIPAALSPS
ncbi:hypothetical protein MHYP_G00042470 [Metynnis hypsauchen]